MKMEKYEAPKAVVVDFENDYVVARSGGTTDIGSGTSMTPHSGGGGVN